MDVNWETLGQIFILSTIADHESCFRKHCTPMRKMIYISLSTYRVIIQLTAMIQNKKSCYGFRVFQIDEEMHFLTTENRYVYISWKLYLINEHPHLIQNDFWWFSFNDVHVHGTNYLSIMFGAYQNKVLMFECSCEQTSCSRTYFSLSSAFLPWRQ